MAVRLRIGLAVTALMLAAPATRAADPTPAPPTRAAAAAAAPFAVVGDTVISSADYQRALQVAMRKKYYHAKPPEAEFAKFQREVADEVVNRVLLLAEARRRGVQPDHDKIKATIAGYDAQYKGSANWAANREKMLASLTPALETDSLLERFEKIVRTVPEPTEAQAREHYDKHKDLFVEPEQVKLSVILFKVDPSSRQEVWNGAHAEAKAVHRKLVGGADFGELARLHSGDRSAARGGEMEYTHRGMLPEALHAAVDKLQPGGLSEPVQLLEGVAILRMDGRKPAAQRSFEQVKVRAAELWKRAEADARWASLIADLRRNTKIRIDESQYGPLRGTAEKARTG
jgi:parvulin-like peptidyl-prolyl isomerase